MTWTQNYIPLHNLLVSTLVAAIPVVLLLGLLAFFHVRAHWAALAGLLAALSIAVLVYGMPKKLAVMSAIYGAGFGLFPIGWIVLCAIFVYDITVHTGQFEVVKQTIAGLADDRRVQALLIAFSFGAFIEGAAGFGTPVAISAAMLIGLGFRPLSAAALALIGNTAPVAYGALGTPIVTLASVTGLDVLKLSAMAGRQLPFFSLIVPFWLVWAMVGWRKMIEVWPACLTAGASFAVVQFAVSNYHGPWVVDIAGSIASILSLIVLLKFWKPREVWRFDHDSEAEPDLNRHPGEPAIAPLEVSLCLELGRATVVVNDDQLSLAIGKRGQNVRLAARLTGWDIDILTPPEFQAGVERMDKTLKSIEGVTQKHVDKIIALGLIDVRDIEEVGTEPLMEEVGLPAELATIVVDRCGAEAKLVAVEQEKKKSEAAVARAAAPAIPGALTRQQVIRAWMPWVILSLFVFVWGLPWVKAKLNLVSKDINVAALHEHVRRAHPVAPPDAKPEKAIFSFNWLSATGTALLLSGLVSGFVLGLDPVTLAKLFGKTFWRVRMSLLTIALMLALGYSTKYAGLDATLGLAFASTGVLFPFFSPLLGWLGVALTGSDTSSNVLFGSLQTITAGQLKISPLLAAASNSTGGVMGKMIDAQSIVVAGVATGQHGQEGIILRKVFFHSIALAALVGVLVFLQAYTLRWMIP